MTKDEAGPDGVGGTHTRGQKQRIRRGAQKQPLSMQ